ncbi:glucose dehydrogenase [FAD, quinone]-like [Glandiceps talaboti]
MADVFDYVVVGAGSAGCVVANRLSENENTSVLLIEAGPEDTEPKITVPAECFNLIGSDLDWKYLTVPQKNACLAMKDHCSIWIKGKVLGGSSSINGMVYVRGCKEDYDSWARLGAEGWSYEDVLPYFLKSENNTNEEYLKTEYHSKGGPMTVSDVFPRTKFGDMIAEAAEELGYELKDCNNCIDIVGFGRGQATIKDGKRESTVTAFLNPVKSRKNLTIWTETMATKILFDGNAATKLEVTRKGTNGVVNITKELILSAGTVGSPQLLMLSGVGPKEHLEELGIPVFCDLPVGENLQDHIMTTIRFNGSGGCFIQDGQDRPTKNGLDFSGPIKTKENLPWPDIQLLYSPDFYHFGSGEKEKRGHDDRFDETFHYTNVRKEDMSTKEGLTLMSALLHPKSVGNLKLKSKDPLEPPLMDPHYLEEQEDVETMIRGIRVIQKLSCTKTMKDSGITPELFKFDNCPHEMDSNGYWEHVVRHVTHTIWHIIGTCKMGAKDDKSAVVDPSLRVRGINNVRVIDAAIMPHLTSGNTNAPTIMIGEKGADLIKKENK